MTADLLSRRPAVKPDVLLGPALLRGPAPSHLIKDPETGRSFEVGVKEHFVIARLDGTRTLAEIGDEYAEHFGRRLAEPSWQQLLGLLYTRQLLSGAPAARGRGAAESAAVQDVPAKRSSPMSGRLRITASASAAIDRLHSRVKYALSVAFVLPTMILVGCMTVAIGLNLSELAEQTARAFRDPVAAVTVTGALWVSAAIHELSHGVLARRFGGTVTEIGIRWHLFVVFLYCKVDNYLYLRSRWHQVAIAGVGAFANMVFLLPFFAVWLAVPQGGPARDGLGCLILVGSGLALVNLVPVPPTDGYKMLGHWFGMPDLGPQSQRFVWLVLRRWLGKGDGATGYPRKARWVYSLYALGSAALAGALVAGVVLICHRLFLRFGVSALLVPALLLAALVAVAGVPIVRRRRRIRQPPTNRHPAGRHRPEGHRTMSTSRSAASATGPAIVLDTVRKSYGDIHAVNGISLTVERGEFFGLLGPNGAGKTTLVEIATGLRRADSGTVAVLGESPWPRNLSLIPRLGVQTQTSAFFVRLTAREHLRTVASLYGFGGRAVVRALRMVGLTDKADARVDDLSGGQRQRLAIAAALLHEPELIFLDEPTAALDPQARRALWKVLRELKDDGRTVIYTTHHLDEAEALCDRVAIVVGGAVVALDTPQNLALTAAGPTRLLVPADRISLDQARALTGVDAAELDGGCVVIETMAAGHVLASLDAVAGLQGVRTRTASLEDFYLELTGS